MAAERRFAAMGSDAHLIVSGGPDHLLDQAQARVVQLEERWSRFLVDSEVTRLNRKAGEFVVVSADTIALVRRAIDAHWLSAGAFDATVLGAVIRSGYDRSFEQLGPTPAAGHSLLGTGSEGITVEGSSVRLAAGTGFDPGGIGKGFAADIVAAEVMDSGAQGVCVNLGGDLRVMGDGPDGASWTVALEHPWSARAVCLLGISDGAVATSTTLRRRWSTDGEARHHLIDPRTGEVSDSGVDLAVVVAAEGWIAEALAKCVLLAGADHPFDAIGGTGAEAIAVDRLGRIQHTDGFLRFLGESSLPISVDPMELCSAASGPPVEQGLR
jgi:thiamine biosynthesis lipoprotein